MQSFYQNGFRSPYYSGSLQRYLRAVFLEDAGRLDEALRLYSSFEQISMFDFAFLAVSHMRRALIYERRGDIVAAQRHYARFVELWANCDPELRPLVENAEQRLAALDTDH